MKSTKNFWFFSPTQLFTHGQWWSIFLIQRLHTLRGAHTHTNITAWCSHIEKRPGNTSCSFWKHEDQPQCLVNSIQQFKTRTPTQQSEWRDPPLLLATFSCMVHTVCAPNGTLVPIMAHYIGNRVTFGTNDMLTLLEVSDGNNLLNWTVLPHHTGESRRRYIIEVRG